MQGQGDDVPRRGTTHAALMQRLTDREAAIRKAAAREAGEQVVRAVAPRLAELLRDHNSGVAATAAWALGRLRHAPAESQLAGLLSASSAAVRKNAAWALGRIGTPDALGALLGAWPDADEAAARSILLALDELPVAETTPRLVALLHDSRGSARSRAALGLLRRSTEALPLLLAALDETSGAPEQVLFRRAVAHVLAGAAAPASLDALLALSHEDDARTRLYATRGLGALAGAPEAARERLHALTGDERRDVAAAARGALGAPAGDVAPVDTHASGVLPLDLAPGLTYLLTVLPGLEGIAADEVEGLPGARVTRRYRGALLARLDAPPTALGELRTVLDALLFAGELPVPGADATARDRRFARAACGAIAAARPDLLLTLYVAVPRGTPAATAAAQRAGAESALSKTEARVSASGAALTAGVVSSDETALLGLRVLRDPPSHRPLPAGGMPASLHATLAAALVGLTEPAPDDVFLDPLCGAGTLLRERALAGPYARLLGGDAGEQALALARENLRDWPHVSLEQWDATRLPLDDASVDKAALNPPYGRRSGSHAENRDLYPALLSELARVVRRGGLIALVTAERRLTVAALRGQTALARQAELPVRAGGSGVVVYVLRRR